MKHLLSLILAPAAGFALALGTTEALAQSEGPWMNSDQVATALKGKVCTTKGGAKFTFTVDGHYAYAGLGFTHSGHYTFGDGAVSVLLDSGLGRSFTITTKGDRLYMEQTGIRCGAIEESKMSVSVAR